MSVKRAVDFAILSGSEPYAATAEMFEIAYAAQGGTEARSSQGCRGQRARSHGELYCVSCGLVKAFRPEAS